MGGVDISNYTLINNINYMMTKNAIVKVLELASKMSKEEQSKFADYITEQKPLSVRDVEMVYDDFKKSLSK